MEKRHVTVIEWTVDKYAIVVTAFCHGLKYIAYIALMPNVSVLRTAHFVRRTEQRLVQLIVFVLFSEAGILSDKIASANTHLIVMSNSGSCVQYLLGSTFSAERREE